MLSKRLICVLGACVAMIAACESSTDVQGSTNFIATLNGANEKPTAITTSATGVFTAAVNPSNTTLSYSITWTGLSGRANGAHIHGPGGTDVIANVIVDFSAPPTGATNAVTTNLAGGPTSGTVTSGSASGNLNLALDVAPGITGAQFLEYLNTGQLYVNVHTVANSGGEIRGQITKQQ
jgi:CHRD domain-containing protein